MGLLSFIMSGKGGCGKSTVSVGLASALSEMKRKVLLIDTDAGLRCLDLMLGVSDKLVFDLGDILNNGKSLNETALSVNDNIDLIAAPASSANYVFNPKAFKDLLMLACDVYDNVIIDSPAGLNNRVLNALPSFTEVLVVETPNEIGRRSASSCEQALYENGLPYSYLVLNKFDYFTYSSKNVVNIDDFIDSCGLQLKGIIPFDEQLSSSELNGKLFNKNYSFRAFCRLARRVCGQEISLPKLSNL